MGAVCKVLYGEREIAQHPTVGAAMNAPTSGIPLGARIVADGVVHGRLATCVSKETGAIYAGWMFTAERERVER